MNTRREGVRVRVIDGINNSQVQTCVSPCPLTPSFPKLFRRRFAGVVKASTRSLALNPGASMHHYSTKQTFRLCPYEIIQKERLHDSLKQRPPFPLTSQTLIQNPRPALTSATTLLPNLLFLFSVTNLNPASFVSIFSFPFVTIFLLFYLI